MANTYEMMDQNLMKALDAAELDYDGCEDSDSTSYDITFHDSFGNEGSISIMIFEGKDKYEVSTSKAKDDHETKNERDIKSVKAVMNYIEKHTA